MFQNQVIEEETKSQVSSSISSTPKKSSSGRKNKDIIIEYEDVDQEKSRQEIAVQKISEKFQCKHDDVFICL